MSGSPSPAPPAPLFRERLWPSWWIWLVVLGLGGTAAVAFTPVSVVAGAVAGAATALALGVALLVNTPVLEVDAATVRVGRAVIEQRHVGGVSAHRGEDATHERGPGLNGTAYLCLRGWIDPVVRIEITDELDATPYWLASTRRPEEFVRAVEAARSPGR